MKHPIAFKCFVLAAMLAANGCTYDNLDKLNQTTDDGQGRERQCEVSKCDLPKHQEGVSVSAHYSPSENGCVCEYKCVAGFGAKAGTSGNNLVCESNCTENDCKSNPEHAHLVNVSGTISECSCVYECNIGYTSNGSNGPDIDCKPNGTCTDEFGCSSEIYQHCYKKSGNENGVCVECLDYSHCPGMTDVEPFGFYCSKEYTCVPKLDNGFACSEDFECKSGYCNPDDKVCDCNNTDDKGDVCCYSLSYPKAFWSTGQSKCVEGKEIGDKCNSDEECLSKKCEPDSEGISVCKENADECSDLECPDVPSNAQAKPKKVNGECDCNYQCNEGFVDINYDGSKGDGLVCAESCPEANCSNTLATDDISFVLGYKVGVLCQCVYQCGDDKYDLSTSGGPINCCNAIELQFSSDKQKCVECTENEHCTPNNAYFCSGENKCVEKKENGIECFEAKECKSNKCEDVNGTNVCVENASVCTQTTCESSLTVLPGSVEFVSTSDNGNGTCSCLYRCGTNSYDLSIPENYTPCCSSISSSTPYWSSIGGKCVAKKVEGDACNSSSECSTNNCKSKKCAACDNDTCCKANDPNKPYWSSSTNQCVAKKANGEACTSGSECSSNNCKSRKCAACDNDTCCKANDPNKPYWSSTKSQCVAKKVDGDACTANTQCNSNYCNASQKCETCNNDTCCNVIDSSTPYWSSTGNQCVAAKVIGDTCDDNMQCQSKNCKSRKCATCNNDTCCNAINSSKPYWSTTTKKCVAKKENSDTCQTDNECKSDHCNGATCVECTQSKPCSDSNKYCDVNSTCQTKKPNGQECADNKECSSGICNGGKCAECNTDNQCKDKYGTTKPYCSIELGLCVQKKIGDDPCNNKSECSSNKCISGVCGCSNQSDCVRTDYMCHDSRCILRRSLLGGELCKNANACKSGQCLQGYDGETRCRCSADANGIVAECKGGLDLVCNTYTAAGECRSDCYGACVPKYSLELGEECASNEVCNTNYCYFNGHDFLGRCACINGSFDYIDDVVQYCRNYTYTNDLWYYNYLLGYECPSENAFALKYASRNTSSDDVSFEGIIGNTDWCGLLRQYLDGTEESLHIESSANSDAGPMCFVQGNKAFELYYSSGDLSLTSCEYGCNTGFTACHENIRSSCASHELDMLLYVDIDNILTWTEDSININLRGIDSNKGQLCYNDLMIRIYSCALNIPEIVTDIAGSCIFGLYGADTSSYDICIDFYNKDTYEKRSYYFDVNGGGGESSAKYCPRGCNVDYSGCNDL